ncbi:hypothetical protein FJT64_004731 [Amphibalanus amphitrite]|uniref:Uncharacterized protein n=1 Tax=Amphibalanus amphitrite TaxID=1232801 RepID=A0A6A4VNY5_AMPAM|nr:hypothetical protein FJT64_004731 [Amphibalanus amphitrite]
MDQKTQPAGAGAAAGTGAAAGAGAAAAAASHAAAAAAAAAAQPDYLRVATAPRSHVAPPRFFEEDPVIWLVQLDLFFSQAAVDDELSRFRIAATLLPGHLLRDFTDILRNPPLDRPYTILSDAIRQRFGKSLLVALLVATSRINGDGSLPPGDADGPPYPLPRVSSDDCLLAMRRCRRPVQPSWCGLLLMTCLLAGDVHPNPGPSCDVTILTQNVQSINNKLGDLRQSAVELEKFSLVAWTETWLGDAVASSELEAALPGHELFRRDRVGRAGGGVSCFARRSLCPERRKELEPEGAEMLVLAVQTVPPLLLAVCYCPPDSAAELTATMAGLTDLVRSAAGGPVVAVGDFNVPDVAWAADGAGGGGGAVPVLTRRSRRAVELLDGCHLAGLVQHVYQPTRGANFLDLTLSNDQNIVAEVRDGIFSSDHKEMVCQLSTVRGPIPTVSRSSALNYKRADWAGLRAALQLAPWSMLDGLPVDDATEVLYDLLSAAIRDYIPLVQFKRRQPPWFDQELRAALREERRRLGRIDADGFNLLLANTDWSSVFRAQHTADKWEAHRQIFLGQLDTVAPVTRAQQRAKGSISVVK